VGISSFILAFVTLAPFVIFFVLSAKFITVQTVFAPYPEELGKPDWAVLLASVLWLYSGFDTVAAISEEVRRPRRTFPLAMGITVVLVTLVYLLPTIAGLSIEPNLESWKSGSFAEVAKKVPYCSNGWLSFWISLAGALSALSLLNVALSCTGRETYAAGKMLAYPGGSLVGRLHKNCRGDSLPIIGIVIMSLLTVPMSLFAFDVLVGWSGLLTAVTQLIQVVVFVYCRKKSIEGDAEESPDRSETVRPTSEKFMIGGGWIGAGICAGSLGVMSLIMCVVSGWQSLLISMALVCGCFLIYGISRVVSKTSCCIDYGDIIGTEVLKGEQMNEDDIEVETP
jgi:amino acid transporter